MVSSEFSKKNIKSLPIEEIAPYYTLYTIWQTVEADLKDAGLGMPSTFANHLSRINSKTPGVKAEEMKWLESLIKSTHSLQPDQFRKKDDHPEHHSSQNTGTQTLASEDAYPTPFLGNGQLAIPRMRPYRTVVLPGFAVPNAEDFELSFGYTKDQIKHALKIILSASPYNTFHDSGNKRQTDCIKKLHAQRPGWTIAELYPDIVPGIICPKCDAEGFVIANFILAYFGWHGAANTKTIPIAQLKTQAQQFIKSENKVSFEHLLWQFGAQGFADNKVINGTEIYHWNMLTKEPDFDTYFGWVPKTLTKQAHKDKQIRIAALAAQKQAELAAARGNALGGPSNSVGP